MKLIDLIVTFFMCVSVVSCVGRYAAEAIEGYSLKDFIKGKASEFRMQTSIRVFIRLYILFSVLVSVLVLFLDGLFDQYEDTLGINFIDSRFEFSLFLLILRAIFFAIVIFAGIVFSTLIEKKTYEKIKTNVNDFSWKNIKQTTMNNFKKMWNWFIMKDNNQEV